ncbi:extracellular solute-binding protein [Paenibacillus cymbidii]|uniref:extracellular solute-binding protein n=1 Tax=Paenibacillus cymbidii TaxID=1639034 RepID=UPI0010813666|nr:extracellular solute-binding protein [Paenibacillus cymbidii]
MKCTLRATALIALTAVLSITAACGKSETPKGAAGTAAPSAASATEAPKPQLRALHQWQKDDYNTYPVAKVIEDRTGYKVQYDMLPQDDATSKLNLLISSGEPYDYVLTGGDSATKALYSDYARRGALVDLGPLIDKYGPNLKASISQESWDAIKVDGKIYAVPTRSIDFASNDLIIRQDWLDKLNLTMPTTVDEFITVLKTFKEKDPGGNGDKNIPFTIGGTTPLVANLSGAFGIPNNWNDVGGKLVPNPLNPAFEPYLVFMNELFKQKLLDQEFPVNKSATVLEKFTSGRAGIIQINWADAPTIADALAKNQPNAKYTLVPPLKGKDGKSGLSSNGGGLDRITFVPKSSKHPEDAIKLMNAKLEKDTFKLMTLGVEGKHYTFKDGVYSPILPIFTDERNASNNYLNGIDEQNYPTYWQARVRKDARLFAAWEYMNLKLPASSRVADPLGMAPYLAEYAKNNQTLATLINDYGVKVIVGAEPISGLEAFRQKYKQSGGEASQNEINAWYAGKKK